MILLAVENVVRVEEDFLSVLRGAREWMDEYDFVTMVANDFEDLFGCILALLSSSTIISSSKSDFCVVMLCLFHKVEFFRFRFFWFLTWRRVI